MTNASLVDRFWTRVTIPYSPAQCWIWSGTKDRNGYGTLREGTGHRKRIQAHRASYLIHYGDIPNGLVLDHLCRDKSCVNPLHLRAVSMRENTLAGLRVGPQPKMWKAVCIRGHEKTPENIGVYRGRVLKRYCRPCQAMHARGRYQRKKGSAVNG